MKIAPSILASNFCKLSQELEAITNANASIIHLDIMDGHYVPNLTFGLPVVQAIAKEAKLPLDAHLMVLNPDTYVDTFAELGVEYFSFHPETVFHPDGLIQKIKTRKMKAGIAINPGTSVNCIVELLYCVDFVLVMTVNPGFTGQKFITSTVSKIKYLDEFRKLHKLKYEIEVDGGINFDTIKHLTPYNVDIVVAGAYIFHSKDYGEAIRTLNSAYIL